MRKYILVLACILAAALHLEAQQAHLAQRFGPFKRYEKIPHGIRIEASNGILTLTVYSPTIIRARFAADQEPADSSYAVIRQPQSNFSHLADSKDSLVLFTDSVRLVVHKNPFGLDFYNAQGQFLDGDYPALGVNTQGTEVSDYRTLTPDEKFLGLGEKTGPLNRREQSYVNWNTDAYGYGPGQDPIYSTMPIYFGVHAHSLFAQFFDNTYKSFFNFGGSTDGTSYFFGAPDGNMNYYFFGASSIPAIIQDYTWLTGRMHMPPLWSLGYQQSRYSYMTQQQLLDIARHLRRDSIPCDVMYCDIDYMRGYRVFTWNPTTYAHPRQLTDSLKAMGMHLVTIIDPGIKIDSQGYAPYLEGAAHGYFARYPNGSYYTGSVWAGRSHFPDFTRDVVRQWWGKQFKVLVDGGVTGFWNDMNEPSAWGQNIPQLIEFGTGKHLKSLKQVRNVYGLEMVRGTYNGTRELMHGDRPFVLSRAAYSGIQRYSAMWTGDNNPNDDHMLLGFRLINSMGLSGEPYVGMDVGGFTGDPTPDLMVRWMSLGTFTPMFRNHTAKGNLMHEPWVWGDNREPLIRKSIDLRYELLPYLYSTMYEATQNGMPVNRTLAIAHPHDDRVYDGRFENEFCFGKFFLVAPVVSYKTTADVYLPEGTWYRFSSGKAYQGGSDYLVEAPLDDLPVFVRGGSLIPMQEVIQSTADKGDGLLRLQVYYGQHPTDFCYYEDDGTTYHYEHGAYFKRMLYFNPDAASLHWDAAQGSYNSRYTKVDVILHGFPAGIRTVHVNGTAYSLVEHPDGTQSLELPWTSSALTINW